MPDEPKEIGKFGLGIKIIRHPDGRVEYQTQSANQSVPVEIVIMQIKAFLNNLEKDYFNNFDRSTSKFGKD